MIVVDENVATMVVDIAVVALLFGIWIYQGIRMWLRQRSTANSLDGR